MENQEFNVDILNLRFLETFKWKDQITNYMYFWSESIGFYEPKEKPLRVVSF